MRRTKPSAPGLCQIKQKDLALFRAKIHKRQNLICPILQQKIPFTDTVVDHQHGAKAIPTGHKGKGIIRGVIQTQANALEGKISNAYIRYGLKKFMPLPDLLRSIADYLENPPLMNPLIGPRYVHPSEIEKPKKVKKNCYKKLVKAWKARYPKKKPPTLSKRGFLTKPLEKAFAEFSIKIEYLK